MKRPLLISTLVVGSCLAGIVAGQWVLRSPPCRDAIGLLFGRGHLLALVHGRGVYEADLSRALAETAEAAGEDRHLTDNRVEMLRWLIANTAARVFATREQIAPADIDREIELLQWQFRDCKECRRALRNSGLATGSLRRVLADDLRALHWILHRIESEIQTTPDESRAFYEAHPESFTQPVRLRASHLFLAAPPETPLEIVDQKREKIEALAKRLAAGEDFFELVALESEDEETKARGGDLGFFAASRMPADFIAAVQKLEVGQISPPVRTQLGFHIIEVTDFKPARQMGLDEVQPEIARSLENRKRQIAVSYLPAALLQHVEFARR